MGGGGGVMNWEIGIDMYTLMCIKLMTNKNLLCKKINKIKLKKKNLKQRTRVWGGRVSWDEVREWHGLIYTTKCKIDS